MAATLRTARPTVVISSSRDLSKAVTTPLLLSPHTVDMVVLLLLRMDTVRRRHPASGVLPLLRRPGNMEAQDTVLLLRNLPTGSPSTHSKVMEGNSTRDQATGSKATVNHPTVSRPMGSLRLTRDLPRGTSTPARVPGTKDSYIKQSAPLHEP